MKRARLPCETIYVVYRSFISGSDIGALFGAFMTPRSTTWFLSFSLFSLFLVFFLVAASTYRRTKRQEASWEKSIARTASCRGESLLGVRGIEIVRAVDRKIGGRAPQRALLSNRIIYRSIREKRMVPESTFAASLARGGSTIEKRAAASYWQKD